MQSWLLIRTRSRWEKKVSQLLAEKGIELFCPLQKVQHRWSDRVKTLEMPLLETLIFVKVTKDQLTEVRLTEGVLNFVYQNGKPVSVKEKVVQTIRDVQQSCCDIKILEVDAHNGKPEPVVQSNRAKGKMVNLSLGDRKLILVGYTRHPEVGKQPGTKN